MINTQKQFKKSSKSDKLTVPVQFKAQFYRHNVETKCGLRKKQTNKTKQKKSFPATTTTLFSFSLCTSKDDFCLLCVFARVNKEAETQSSPSALSATNKPCSEGSNKNPFLSF